MGSQVEERARSISALDLAKSSRIPGLVSAFRALVPIPTQKAPVLDNRHLQCRTTKMSRKGRQAKPRR